MADLTSAIQAATAATSVTEVKFGGNVYRVKPPMQWRQSAMEAVTAGRINAWARLCMVNDADGETAGADDGQAFVNADLTNAEVLEFFQAFADAAGQSPGESQPSQS